MKVGVTAAHGEEVVPINERFSTFFEHLAAAGARVEALGAPLSADGLGDLGGLVLGGPTKIFTPDEVHAVHEWLERGGRLLLLATDSEPLNALLPGWRLGHTLRYALRARARVWYDHVTLRPWFDYIHGRALLGGPGEVVTSIRTGPSLVFAHVKRGAGAISVLGSTRTLDDDALAPSKKPQEPSNFELLEWLVREWLPGLVGVELASRMKRPQRHRLLHGYPMAPLMRDAATNKRVIEDALQWSGTDDSTRKLTVGVLPHPYCNPAVKGCGFCTFPHQDYAHSKADEVARHVVRELELSPFHKGRPAVDALYFGGATANLTPPESFRALCKKLRERFDLAKAEVSLEGVPVYFAAKKPSLIEIMKEELGARHYRISMGVQTFDPAQIARMGRTAFGDRSLIEKVVADAHEAGLTVSADLLFDLPGQSREQMRADADTAIAIGFDQVCLYHLVLAPELGTEWSKDAELLAAIPTNERACENSLALREHMLAAGFVQTTLTNFERREVNASERRFIYEDCGFKPETYDTLGFGPSGLSLLMSSSHDADWGLKLMNAEKAPEYVARIESGFAPERLFVLRERDLEILHFTRQVARLGAARVTPRFALELDAVERAGLMTRTGEAVALTPRGMFYADSIAGLVASSAVRLQRARGARGRATAPDPNLAVPGPMG